MSWRSPETADAAVATAGAPWPDRTRGDVVQVRVERRAGQVACQEQEEKPAGQGQLHRYLVARLFAKERGATPPEPPPGELFTPPRPWTA